MDKFPTLDVTPRTSVELPSAEFVRALLNYNPERGTFTWAMSRQGVRLDAPPGTRAPDGRLEIAIKGKRHKAARLAWLLVTGRWPTGEVDHRNGDPSDDRFVNLRDVSHGVNIQNQTRPQQSNKSSKLLGVSRHSSGSWQGRIQLAGKNLYLGSFSTPEEAHAAYVAAKRALHEGCTI